MNMREMHEIKQDLDRLERLLHWYRAFGIAMNIAALALGFVIGWIGRGAL